MTKSHEHAIRESFSERRPYNQIFGRSRFAEEVAHGCSSSSVLMSNQVVPGSSRTKTNVMSCKDL